MSKAKPGKPQIVIHKVAGNWKSSLPAYQRMIKLWCEAAMKETGRGDVAVVLADDAFIHDLNHTYRGKDTPTNVLSFAGKDGELGDIVLSYDTIAKEAKAQEKSFECHTAHLVVHGCLHLLGHDHEKASDAHMMESKEISILRTLGYPNPYEAA